MKPIAFFFTQYTDYEKLIADQSKIIPPSAFRGGKRQTAMEENEYPFYHPLYVPPKRDMKAIKKDFNKYLDKLNSKKRQTPMNALASMIAILTSPVAHRKGVTISAEDCKMWAEELRNYEEYVTKELKNYYELKALNSKKKLK